MSKIRNVDAALAGHFDTVADDRVPDGLLGDVVRRVADIRPRPAWVVAVRGNVIAPVQSLATHPVARWLAVAALVVLALALTMLAGAGGPGGRSPFHGLWTSTDSDGSSQTLTVGRGASPAVTFEDDFASMCEANGDPKPSWHGDGTGTVKDSELSVAFGRSGCSTWFTDSESFEFVYDASDDTLVDSFGVVWHRAG